MAAKVILALCASALFVQVSVGSCMGSAKLAVPAVVAAAPPAPCGAGWPSAGVAALPIASSSGGALIVTSASPIAPSGISVRSENAIEGPLAVMGELPFLAAVALEGNMATSGFAGADYSCGDGRIEIISESAAPAYAAPAYSAPLAAAPLAAAPWSNAPLAAGPWSAAPLSAASLTTASLAAPSWAAAPDFAAVSLLPASGRAGCGCSSIY